MTNLQWLDNIFTMHNLKSQPGKLNTHQAKAAIAAKLQNNQNIVDDIQLVARAETPAEWTDEFTGNRLYNQAALKQVMLELIGEDEKIGSVSSWVNVRSIKNALRNKLRAEAQERFGGTE